MLRQCSYAPYAWWRKTRNEPLNELSAIKSCGRLSDFQAAVIEWLIEFRETCPNEPVPEEPPWRLSGAISSSIAV